MYIINSMAAYKLHVDTVVHTVQLYTRVGHLQRQSCMTLMSVDSFLY